VLHTSAMTKAQPQTFWDRLEEASQDVGLPFGLSDIGRELDIWPSAVQKWRDGEGLPGQKNLITLATNRGVNTEWLKTGRGPKLSEDAMDAATREFLAIWTKLDDTARQRLLNAAHYERASKSTPEPTPPATPAGRPTTPFR
jgi:hypothetical protein